MRDGKRQKPLTQSVMVLLYIRLIDRLWYPPESLEVPHQPTSKKPELELEQADNTNARQAKNAEAIRKLQQVYHLERRLFV